MTQKESDFCCGFKLVATVLVDARSDESEKLEKDREKTKRSFQPPEGWRPSWGDFRSLYRRIERKEKRKWRKTAIPFSTQKKVVVRSRGKCEKCGIKLSKKLIPDFHDKKGDSLEHETDNILVLCPKCHRRELDKPEKSKRNN